MSHSENTQDVVQCGIDKGNPINGKCKTDQRRCWSLRDQLVRKDVEKYMQTDESRKAGASRGAQGDCSTVTVAIHLTMTDAIKGLMFIVLIKICELLVYTSHTVYIYVVQVERKIHGY